MAKTKLTIGAIIEAFKDAKPEDLDAIGGMIEQARRIHADEKERKARISAQEREAKENARLKDSLLKSAHLTANAREIKIQGMADSILDKAREKAGTKVQGDSTGEGGETGE